MLILYKEVNGRGVRETLSDGFIEDLARESGREREKKGKEVLSIAVSDTREELVPKSPGKNTLARQNNVEKMSVMPGAKTLKKPAILWADVFSNPSSSSSSSSLNPLKRVDNDQSDRPHAFFSPSLEGRR